MGLPSYIDHSDIIPLLYKHYVILVFKICSILFFVIFIQRFVIKGFKYMADDDENIKYIDEENINFRNYLSKKKN